MSRAAEDFREEVETLEGLVSSLAPEDYSAVTQFKDWTVDDVLGHLHLFDTAVLNALDGDTAFEAFFAPIAARLKQGQSLVQAQRPWLGDLSGPDLFGRWRETAHTVADRFAATDPKRRLKWAGPDMSALSSVTARQMETWAHGQEVFDRFGLARAEGDRVRNICHLGVSTFGWSYANRGLPVPDRAPYVRLLGPSGAVFEWNARQNDNAVTGNAVDFARVVTQVRSVEDTRLETRGAVARHWMQIAQCFAGPPEDPPQPGARHTVASCNQSYSSL